MCLLTIEDWILGREDARGGAGGATADLVKELSPKIPEKKSHLLEATPISNS